MTTTTWQSTPAGKAFLLRHGKKKRVRITWLARARILSGQSVAQAAKVCGLNPRTWAAWERTGDGRRAPGSAAIGPLMSFLVDFGTTAYELTTAPYTNVNPATLEVLDER